MAIVIRLTKVGRKGEARFRIVAKEKRSKRDGRSVETLGWYEKTEKGEKKQLKEDRIRYWFSKGAKASPAVSRLLE